MEEFENEIVFEKPLANIETNNYIDVVDNSILFDTTKNYVKKATEYTSLKYPEKQLSSVIVCEHDTQNFVQLKKVDQPKLSICKTNDTEIIINKKQKGKF